MLEYFVECNPLFDISKHPTEENKSLQRHYTQFYTDTDSMVTHQKNIKDLKLDSKKLGAMSDELDKYPNAKIVKAFFIAPKLYCLGFITEDSENPKTPKDIENDSKGLVQCREINGKKIYWHIRCKGVPKANNVWEEGKRITKWEINPDNYKYMNDGGTHVAEKKVAFKKHGISHEDPFAISFQPIKRELNRTSWNGRFFYEDGTSLPFGHALNQTNLM